MNSICNIEFSEYEGQYTKDLTGAIEGCDCYICRGIRNEFYEENKTIKSDEDNESI